METESDNDIADMSDVSASDDLTIDDVDGFENARKRARTQIELEGNAGLDFNQIKWSSVYDQRIREILAKMFTVNGYPFSMVEEKWFNIYSKALNPNYQEMSRVTLRYDCFKLYESEKEKLKELLKNAKRVCLTSNRWTSEKTIDYIYVTLHYVDPEWKLRTCVINFCELEPPRTGVVLADCISRCIHEWGIEDKVQTITLDNASSNGVVASCLKNRLIARNKLHLKGNFFHVPCVANMLNLLVQDGLKEIAFVVENVRETVKYLKMSQSHLHKFGQIAWQLGFSTVKGLRLDVPTCLNSTYVMLEHAIHFKLVLKEYAVRDANYEWLPSDDDWIKAEKVCKFFSVVNKTLKLFSGSGYPTANLFLTKVWHVKHLLDMTLASDDEFMKKIAATMAIHFEKFWRESSMLMSVATVLDPRYKMLYLSYVFPKLYSDKESENHLQKVQQVIRELYDTYANERAQLLDKEIKTEDNDPSLSKYLEFQKFCESIERNSSYKSELEIYLEEQRFKCLPSKDSTFDVLDWWRSTSCSKPILSAMARDILSIPLSSVSCESTFTMGERVLDPFKSSLPSKTVEALVCCGSWLRDSQDMVDNDEEDDLEVVIPRVLDSEI